MQWFPPDLPVGFKKVPEQGVVVAGSTFKESAAAELAGELAGGEEGGETKVAAPPVVDSVSDGSMMVAVAAAEMEAEAEITAGQGDDSGAEAAPPKPGKLKNVVQLMKCAAAASRALCLCAT